MGNSSMPEIKKPKNSDLDFNEIAGHIANPIDLLSDPGYLKLLEYYQNGEFPKCEELVDQLEILYPQHPRLLKFKDDLQMRLSIKTMEVINKKTEKHQKRRVTFKMSVFAIVATLIVMIVFFFSYYFLSDIATNKQLGPQIAQLNALNDQAEYLLLAGQPQPVVEIIERIRAINPKFENLPELASRTDELLRLEAKYQTASNLVTENEIYEALVIYKEIETEKPGMWDVSHQIASLETSIYIANFLKEGNAAFQEEKWDQVINAYESALMLDPNLVDPFMKEQLLKGYLNQIIIILQDENATIENIENAEQYYRKAVAIIPQNKAFANERGNLQAVSTNLLELKYTQIANANLADKNQTVTSISKAVSYMRKAANIDPENMALQIDMNNAEYYQMTFQHFIEMNWVQTITELKQVLSVDSNYANGNASLLLFEAYYALGKQYYSSGFYLDALENLEQAEILAKDDPDNLMKLFQVQVLIGDTFGKINDYQNAVSYYQYVVNIIQGLPGITNFRDIAIKISDAKILVANKNYQDAFSAFKDILNGIDVIYSISEIEISSGVCLALFANENLSTVDAILEANNLPKTMVITFGRKLEVPILEK